MGRTWVRQFLAQYLSLTFDLGYREDYELNALLEIVPSEWRLREGGKFIYENDSRVPRIRCAHYKFDDFFIGKPIILLTRGIEDTLVSFYYWWLREGTIGAFARDGVADVVDWLGGWELGLPKTERYLHVTYEDLWADAGGSFRAIIDFIGLPFDSGHFYTALERASFDRMRKDQEGMAVERVRKGIVGGYKDELSPEDIAFIQERIKAYSVGHFGKEFDARQR